jgi:signal transduction histidine kinase
MRIDITEPNVSNSVKSYRDIGYTFEIAIADIIDNSITAQAKNIDILASELDNMLVAILDDGIGMNDAELKEAMRLSTKDPDKQREADDLGKFGLGLKTASFSHCKMLTVISKSSSSKISA